MPSRIELVSFELCPYVQRSVLVLLEKGVEHSITYIDLERPPEWFAARSPLRKVPLLIVDDTTLFESSVINEYLDEAYPPRLHPEDLLSKAHQRAWIEVGSELLVDQYRLMTAAAEADFEQARCGIEIKLDRLEQQLSDGPWFSGKELRLVDLAYAPLFHRFELLESWHPLGCYESFPRVHAWHTALLERESIARSVKPDFPERLRAYVTAQDGYAASLFRG